MTTPLTDLLECISDGGGNTGVILCSARLTAGASPSITTDNGFDSSITRNGTGDYTLNFESAFAAAPVAWAIAEGSSDAYIVQLHGQPTTTTMRILIYNDAGSAADPTAVHVFALGA